MQPVPTDVKKHLQHYEQQKQLHPEIGAILVLPATCTQDEHPQLAAFQLVHKYMTRQKVFQEYVTGKHVVAKQYMRVYILNRPTAHNAPGTVVPPAANDLLFNLPCRIAGSKGTVQIDSIIIAYH
jgi:hypothetical protein